MKIIIIYINFVCIALIYVKLNNLESLSSKIEEKVGKALAKISRLADQNEDLEKKLNIVINSNNLEKIGTENKKYIKNYLNKKSLLSKFEELINE